MTKNEMLKLLIKEQVKRGVISLQNAPKQYAWRVKKMTKTEVEIWFADVFGNK